MRKLLVAAIAFSITYSALAEDFVVATGGPKGTYAQFLREISKYCSSSDGLNLVYKETSGSVENLSLLLDNQANAAFVQEDVLFFKDKTDNIQGQVKTLLALYPEEVHILTLSEPLKQVQEGKHIWNKDTTVETTLNTIEDLANRPVGAVGGSYITEQFIRLQSEIPFQVREYPNNDALLKAIQTREVVAGVFVGGQPYPLIGGDPASKKPALGPEWKLLPILPQTVTKMAIYRTAKLKYPKMTASSINSVSTDSLLVTSNYKSPRMVSLLKQLHDCIVAHLDDFRETTGFHAKWRQVDPENKGKWPSVYQFPVEETKKQVSEARHKKK